MELKLKVSKYAPADIVSQLFLLDNSGLDSNPEPLRLQGIQCIPDDNPWDSKPCLCAASPRALWEGLGCMVRARTLPPCNNKFTPFGQTVPWCGSFLPTQKFLDAHSALLPKLYGITSWVMLRVQGGGGEAATSCFL